MIPEKDLAESIGLEESITIFQSGGDAMKNQFFCLAKSLYKTAGLRFVEACMSFSLDLILSKIKPSET
jgi:hypothetical protein